MPLQTRRAHARSLVLSFLNTVVVLAFSFVFFNGTVAGQGKNFLISTKDPAWIVQLNSQGLKPKAKDIDDGYFIALLDNQTHVELQEEYTHFIKEITSDAGVQNGSQISVTYDPGFQQLIFHKIIVWRNNKADDQLKKHKFKILQNEKDLSKFIYRGTYDAFLLLNDIRKGDRIEYAYTIKGNNPIYGQKFASSFYLEGGSTVGYLYNNLIADKNRNLNFKNFNFSTAAKTSEKGNLKIYEWESKLTRTHRIADFEPAWYDPLSYVQVSEYKNWNEVVNWGLAVNKYDQLQTPLLTKKSEELFAKAGSDTTKYIESAIRFVQDEIRYMGIEMGIYSHRPNSPEKVIQQRYGDCKDKSLLLTYLLKARGIAAYMVYIDTYSTIKTNDYLPSPFVFNHVVVRIDYRHKKHWVDPTISYQRGKLDKLYFPNYGYALLIKPGVNALEKVDQKEGGKQVSRLTFDVADTASAKSSSLTIKTTYTGHYADNMRAELAESGTDGIEKSYTEYYAELYTDTELKEPLKVKDDETTNTVEITEHYEISNIWEEDSKNGEKYVAFYGDLIRDQLRKIVAKNRRAPMALKYPTDLEQIITVNMPYEPNIANGDYSIEQPGYRFSVNAFRVGKTQTFHYKLQNLMPFIEGSAIKTYAKDREKIVEYLTYYIDRNGLGLKSGTNPYMIMTFLLALIFSALFFIKTYRQSRPFDLESIREARPIRGWLILLAIRIVVLPFSTLLKQISIGFFDQQTWDGLALLKQEHFIKGIFFVESISFALLLTGGLMCLFLFFNRRESFPRHYIVFSIALLTFTVIDFFAGMLIRHWTNQPLTDVKECLTILFSLTVCLIWVFYLKQSVRVKQTFVFTYPESAWKAAASAQYQAQLASHQDEFIVEEEITKKNEEF
jgi:hypothetical protein